MGCAPELKGNQRIRREALRQIELAATLADDERLPSLALLELAALEHLAERAAGCADGETTGGR